MVTAERERPPLETSFSRMASPMDLAMSLAASWWVKFAKKCSVNQSHVWLYTYALGQDMRFYIEFTNRTPRYAY